LSPSNLRELLETRAAAAPEKDFLFSETDGRRYTYREFDAAVNRTARMLQGSRRVGKGDVVSLLLPNGVEYIVAYFACFKLGALAGPVNSLLKPEEIEYVVGNSESKLLLVGSELREKTEGLKERVPSLREVLTFDDWDEAASGFDKDAGGRLEDIPLAPEIGRAHV